MEEVAAARSEPAVAAVSTALATAYLDGRASAFFAAHPGSAADRAAAVRRATRPLAPEVAQALERQNEQLAPSAARDAHLTALRRGAAAVVTGQQVGLLLGPLYTCYKAATTIVVARRLAAETGLPVVPIFWMQTEDHDAQEIAQIAVSSGQAEVLSLAVPIEAASRVSIAHRQLPGEVEGLHRRLHEALGHLPGAPEHLARLARHYRSGASWGGAFAGLLAELFAADGLVLIDPRDRRFAAAMVAVHTRALREAPALDAALMARAAALEAAGHAVAVAPRPGMTLSFFHPDGVEGARQRLQRDAAEFRLPGRGAALELTALLGELERDPLRFSTSALLRPLLQDELLPTAAYVAGPGEIAYWAQLGPIYEQFERVPPLLVPRARFIAVDDRAARLLERHRLQATDATLPAEQLLARCQPPVGLAAEQLRDQLAAPFDAALEALRPAIEAAGSELDVALARTQGTVHSALEALSRRYEKAVLHRDAELVDQVARLQLLLQPNGQPQERVYGIPSLAARWGEREFTRKVIDAVVPFDGTLRELR